MSDVYILIESFNKDTISIFRRVFLNGFTEIADYYEYPPYFGDSMFETDNIDDMIDFLFTQKKPYYRFYFDSPKQNEDIIQGMVFFNDDDTLVLGLYVIDDKVEVYVSHLEKLFNSTEIIICNEELPPNNAVNFRKLL